jgi:lyso-ornithine lipid O-acyltransferase
MIRAALKLGLYLGFTFACIPFQIVFLQFAPGLARRFPRWYHVQCLKIFGIKLVVQGQPSAAAPVLFVSNHSSYLDIPVLGSLLLGHFVAKREVAGWPLFGYLAKLSRTLFIDRRVSKVADGQSQLLERLKAGDNLILFPEGTSSDGVRVLPFRRALFQAVLDQAGALPVTLQPVTVFCSGIDGAVADRFAKQQYAWFGDMDLLPHLWAFCHLRSAEVRVVFGEASVPTAQLSRHELTATLQAAVTG